VFLIPILTHNLISIKDLCDLGITVSFDQGAMVMEMDGVQIMRIVTNGDVWTCNFEELCDKILAVMTTEEKQFMWWLRAKRAMVTTRSSLKEKEKVIVKEEDDQLIEDDMVRSGWLVNTTSSLKEKEKVIVEEEDDQLEEDDMVRSESRSKLIRLWHLRLGHRSENLIVKDVNSGMLNIGIEKLSQKDLPVNKCACCMKAKSHKLPRSARPVLKTTMVIQKKVTNPSYDPTNTKQQGFGPGIISTDSCGPYTVPSLLSNYVGNHNFMLMDSKKVFTYGYVNKDAETTTRNLKHLLDVELKKLDIKITRYHSDGAKELSGNEITNILNERGIEKTTSTPYSAQENSYIERHFRTEVEATVAMMMYARFLPKSLWFLAKECYTYVYNMLPTQTARGIMSPHKFITGLTPELASLRIFGSKSWVNIPLSKRQKDFKSRALTGYFVGYSAVHSGAFKVWIPEYNRVIISRDVRFDEEIPQGTIDFNKDDYWLEIRQFGHLLTGKPRQVEDFNYLIGEIFYDPEMETYYKVLNVIVYRGDIVAGYAKYVPDKVDQDNAQLAQMHVANVEQLLCPIEGEPLTMKCSAGFQEGEQYSPVDGEKEVGTLTESHGLKRRDICADRTPQNLLYQRRIEDSMDLPVVEDKDLGMSYAYVTTYINELAIPDPMTYREAVEGSYKEQWLLAIAEENEYT